MAVQNLPDSAIEISGHTEGTGKSKKNQDISQQRAVAVMMFLTEVGGGTATRSKSQGQGDAKPIGSTASSAGRWQNRRIEVLIVNE